MSRIGPVDISLGDPTAAMAGVSPGGKRQPHVRLREQSPSSFTSSNAFLHCKGAIFLQWGGRSSWEEMGIEGESGSVLSVVVLSASLTVPTVSRSHEDAEEI